RLASAIDRRGIERAQPLDSGVDARTAALRLCGRTREESRENGEEDQRDQESRARSEHGALCSTLDPGAVNRKRRFSFARVPLWEGMHRRSPATDFEIG